MVNPESQPERSPQQEYIHELIAEFREQLTKEGYQIPIATDGIVALSAAPSQGENEVYEKTDETSARIEYAIQAIKDVTAKRIGKTVDDVSESDIIEHGPPLFLNGEIEQLPPMKEIAISSGFPEEKIQLVDCGQVGSANTQTQFAAMEENPAYKDIKHWTLVTSSYHVPRVARTALKNLRVDRKFDVIGVPLEDFQYDVYRKVRGEVKRIINYSAKGDISSTGPEMIKPHNDD